MNETRDVTRRDFVKTVVAAGVAAGGLAARAQEAGGGAKAMKVALIGCGGRGRGALGNCLAAGQHVGLDLEVVATADYFKTKAEDIGKRYGVSAEKCFGGPQGYRALLEAGPDLVLMATPPNFRPVHFEASIKAGKNVFMEKPVAVDPPGVRRVIAAGEEARAKGLAVVAGTQRRHQAAYRGSQFAVAQGAIGKIVGGTVMWCGGLPWSRTRNQGESDIDYLVRNWLNFVELSGDHIVEQHVHNLDIANWYIGRPPIAALGFGGRAHRPSGNQYDFFSVDFDYGEGCHIHSMCRQIGSCYGRVSEFFAGTEGTVWGGGKTESTNGKTIEIPRFEEQGGPYVQEHVDLLNSIVKGEPLNEARAVAQATMAAIMGRMSAYTGKLIRWSDVMEKADSEWYNFALNPTAEAFETGDVTAPPDGVIPIPG